MKNFIMAILVLISTTCLCQQTHPSLFKSKDHYLREKKIHNNIGWAMLGGGLLAFGVGSAFILGNVLEADESAAILPAAGLGLVIGSIPLFIISGDNNRRAAKISLQTNPHIFLNQNQLTKSKVSAISLKITF